MNYDGEDLKWSEEESNNGNNYKDEALPRGKEIQIQIVKDQNMRQTGTQSYGTHARHVRSHSGRGFRF